MKTKNYATSLLLISLIHFLTLSSCRSSQPLKAGTGTVVDSLYTFVGETFVGPSTYHVSYISKIRWNARAECFYTSDGLVLNEDLSMRYRYNELPVYHNDQGRVGGSGYYFRTSSDVFHYDLIERQTTKLLPVVSELAISIHEGVGDTMLFIRDTRLTDTSRTTVLKYIGTELVDSVQLNVPERYERFAVTPDLHRLFYTTHNELRLLDTQTGDDKLLSEDNSQNTSWRDLKYSVIADRLIAIRQTFTSNEFGTLYLFSGVGDSIMVMPTSPYTLISLHGKKMALGDGGGNVGVYDLMAGENIFGLQLHKIGGIALNGDYLLVADMSSEKTDVLLVDAENGAISRQLEATEDAILPLLWSGNGKSFYYIFKNNIHILDLKTMQSQQATRTGQLFDLGYPLSINSSGTYGAYPANSHNGYNFVDFTNGTVRHLDAGKELNDFYFVDQDRLILSSRGYSLLAEATTGHILDTLPATGMLGETVDGHWRYWSNPENPEELVTAARYDKSNVLVYVDTVEVKVRYDTLGFFAEDYLGTDFKAATYHRGINGQVVRRNADASIDTFPNIPSTEYAIYNRMYSNDNQAVLMYGWNGEITLSDAYEPKRQQKLRSSITVSRDLRNLLIYEGNKFYHYRLKDAGH